jgi:UDP-N-acetylglucosamine 2-epimerase (non-hydrolysing)
MNKILLVFGTRPELIKLAPVIAEFKSRNLRGSLYIVNTNQHKNLDLQDFVYFQVDVDYQFQFQRYGDSLSELNGLMLLGFDGLKSNLNSLGIHIEAIIAQGDTCTSFCAAQFAFYEKPPFYHIEAGLRTYDFGQPFPEEYYRKTISSIASVHFAPTLMAKENLLAEAYAPETIVVTGNTGIDNIRKFQETHGLQSKSRISNNLVLITIHRRENITDNLKTIINRIIGLCNSNPQKTFLWIDNPGYKVKPDIPDQVPNLDVIEPVSFMEMLRLYENAGLLITDSGGIQEEAAYLGIPTLLFRTKTERTESILSGISRFISEQDCDLDLVIAELTQAITQESKTIYGDGFASKRIVDFIRNKQLG